MRRICVFALATSVFFVAGQNMPAFAQENNPVNNSAGGSGGFIEMIFAGAAREPTVPRPYQPEPEYPAYPRAYMPPRPARGSQAASAQVASSSVATAQVTYQAAPASPTNAQAAVGSQAGNQAPRQLFAYQDAPASAPQPRRQPTAAPDFDYVKLIPMPSVGYEPLPPVQQDPPVASAPAYAPSSSGDMAHPQVDPKFDRQVVDYNSPEKPGTVIIDTPHHFLYLVQDQSKAMRYGIGVGKPGFTWQGVKTITAKKEWPDWFPPPEMLQRRPDLPRYMAGGPENPLGARAMYLGSTLYRIHGSNEPWTIGGDVSSGCIRLRNADVIDLYSRVQVGAKVVVM
jgi:lipoprotein-anchoring transpeptidase ErfK/SrfK